MTPTSPPVATAAAAAAQRRSIPLRTKIALQRAVMGMLGVLTLFLLWWMAARFHWINAILISSPADVWKSFREQFQHPDAWRDLAVTFEEWLYGFLIAAVVGICLGVAAGWFRVVRYVVEPWLNFLYSIPELAVIPIYVIWFGIGLPLKIWVGFAVSVVVIAVSAMVGVSHAENRYLVVAQTYGASRRKLFRTVVFPGAWPYIMTGLRQGSGRAVVGVIAAEFIAANEGIGYFITTAGQVLNTPQVITGIIILAIFGLVVGEIFRTIERFFEKWRRVD